MSKRYKKKALQDSPETIAEAKQLTKQVQKPSQAKAQTRLIEQGIQKGITLYKKQHKEKMRQLDKQHKQQQKHKTEENPLAIEKKSNAILPWILLILTWLGIGSAAGLYYYLELI